ncbi:MAG: hypothetical protein ABSF23_12225 [Terracidiphilus sp.]|jgi:hypothetical protein
MKIRLDLSGRALALLWAGFWMFFFVAESVATRAPVQAALPWVGVGLFFILLALLPWRWEAAGGILLALAGCAAGVGYALWAPLQLPAASRVLTSIALSTPALVAGILILMHRRTAPHRV